MCCVIFKGVKCCVDTETGIDFTVKVNIISNTQQDLFKNNFEDEIASFEQLTVMVNYSMEIHSIERIRRHVSYYFNIFFETIDHFKLLSRTPKVLPFAMIDRHGRRLG